MKEQHYWPACEVRKAANGWLVRPVQGFEPVSIDSEFYVFNDWRDAADFLLSVTTANRSE